MLTLNLNTCNTGRVYPPPLLYTQRNVNLEGHDYVLLLESNSYLVVSGGDLLWPILKRRRK